jgi:hypothetical protein
MLKSFADGKTHTADHLVLMLFKKSNEGGETVPSNFALAEFKQYVVSGFPNFYTFDNLSFEVDATYQLMAMAFKASELYPIPVTNPEGIFNISPSLGATLENIHIELLNGRGAPEFFSTMCTAYIGGASTGSSIFTAKDDWSFSESLSLKGTLTRKVAGLSFEVVNISSVVDSMVLIADTLTRAAMAASGAHVEESMLENGSNLQTDSVLGVGIPVNGTLTIESYLLPTVTKFILHVYQGGTYERYTVEVNDVAGVSQDDEITFEPNKLVKIKGNYAEDIGFVIDMSGEGNINLDDNLWNGINEGTDDH